MKIQQKTIEKPISFAGFGVHSGEKSIITLYPANIGSGIVFRSINNNKFNTIKASLNSVSKNIYRISIANNECQIHTVEHILSAIYGLGISNCLIQIDGNEVPILDGSCYPVINKILSCGIVEQKGFNVVISVPYPIHIELNDSYAFVLPSDKLNIIASIHYNHPLIQTQTYKFNFSQEEFISEIAPARTFGFVKEWESLKQFGYALGSNLDNTLVFGDRDVLNPPLRFSDECVRHKVLDFLSALSLLDYRVTGTFYLYRPGHSIDIPFIAKIDSHINNLLSPIEQQKEITQANAFVNQHLYGTENIFSLE